MAEAAFDKPISVRDPELLKQPYEAYSYLVEHAPVYYDASANLYVLSRYDDVVKLLADRTAINSHGAGERLAAAHDPARRARLAALFEAKGWPREPAIGHYDGDDYRERRALFESFLRAGKMRPHQAAIRKIAFDLADGLAAKTEAELVFEYAEPFSLKVICHILGAPDEAIPVVREAMHAMVATIGQIGSTEEEDIAVALKEIAAQHFFKRMIDEKRERPDKTMLSAFVNAPLPSGRMMRESEILMHVMMDLFMAGAETASRALASGVYHLCEDPDLQDRLREDLDRQLPTFVEEILRLESPANNLTRIALRDITLHGVTIPKGSLVMLRAAAANRDPGHFACPAAFDLQRKNAATHLAFGRGPHACVGAPLARMELFWGFKALLERLADIRLVGEAEPEWTPHLAFRGLAELRIGYRPVA